jgi:predicted nucleotidyltransferase
VSVDGAHCNHPAMADAIQDFVDELAARSDVRSILLFGSRARGDARPDSDADLLVVVPEGYRRGVEFRGAQAFELLYLGEDVAMAYLDATPDTAAEVVSSVRVLHDADGSGGRLLDHARQRVERGKDAIDPDELRSSRFNAEDQLRAAEWLADQGDPAGAELLLQHKVLELTASFFDVRRLWTPTVKRRLPAILAVDPGLYELLRSYSTDALGFSARLTLARRMLPLVYGF